MKEIRLYGHLAEFGKSFDLDVQTPAEAVHALCCVVPGFKAHVLAHSEPGYKIFMEGSSIGLEDLACPNAAQVIRIVPVIEGQGKGLGQIVLGGALILFAATGIGSAVLIGGVSISSMAGSIGASLVLGGVAQMLFSPPEAPSSLEAPVSLPGFAFDGPVNTVKEGGAIPFGYGRRVIGSQIIYSGLRTRDV